MHLDNFLGKQAPLSRDDDDACFIEKLEGRREGDAGLSFCHRVSSIISLLVRREHKSRSVTIRYFASIVPTNFLYRLYVWCTRVYPIIAASVFRFSLLQRVRGSSIDFPSTFSFFCLAANLFQSIPPPSLLPPVFPPFRTERNACTSLASFLPATSSSSPLPRRTSESPTRPSPFPLPRAEG